MSVSNMFSYIQGFLSADQDVREDIRKVVQVLEQTAREILTVLQSVHQPSGFKDIPDKCKKARELFSTVRMHIADLKTKFPVDQYYRFHEHWRFVLQRLTFLAAFVVYLESEALVTREEVAQILDIEVVRDKGFHLDVEDYLAGVLIMASELMGPKKMLRLWPTSHDLHEQTNGFPLTLGESGDSRPTDDTPYSQPLCQVEKSTSKVAKSWFLCHIVDPLTQRQQMELPH
nr:translin isoform X1 [Syngnathus scovelli]